MYWPLKIMWYLVKLNDLYLYKCKPKKYTYKCKFMKHKIGNAFQTKLGFSKVRNFTYFSFKLCGIFLFFRKILMLSQNMCKNKKSLRKNWRKNQAVRIFFQYYIHKNWLKILKAKKIAFVKGPFIIYGGGWHRREKGWVN
jgi:hypothetical protein